MLGFQDIIAATSTNTVGGISRATETWWANKATSIGNFDNATAPSYDGLINLGTLFNNCSEGNVTPDGIVMPLTTFGEYENILEGTGYARVEQLKGKGIGTANKLTFRGADVWYDRDCGSTLLYCLNSQFIRLKIQKGLNFAKTPFKEPANQLAKVAFVVVGVQLVTNNSRRLGVGYSIT